MGIDKTCSPLKSEAEGILQELSLLELLSRHGKTGVAGSVALDLVVKRDIDVHVLVSSSDLLVIVDQIYHDLLSKEHVKEVRISDYRERSGIKIGIDSYPGASGDWSVDIWVTNRVESTGFALVERLRQEMSPEQRKAIMEIKSAYHQQGQLRDSMSYIIYGAVIDAGVRDLEGFQQFLTRQPSEGKGKDWRG